MQKGTIVHSYAPANATSIQTRRMRMKAAPDRSEGGFSVVVLVLTAVVARIVVLVFREVDLVQDDSGEVRMRAHDGFQRALGQATPRHLRADDERHAID